MSLSSPSPWFSGHMSLRHEPFFTALTDLDALGVEYATVAAGLVTLRLLDTYTGPLLLPRDVDPGHVRSVRSYVAKDNILPATASLLESIIDALEHTDLGRTRAVTPRLLAYARELEYEGRWELAVDVYQTALELVSEREEPSTRAAVHRRLGICLRILGRLDDALDAYRLSLVIAREAGDVESELRAQHAQASLVLLRGNVPEAEKRLEALQRKARAYRFEGVEAIVMHEMAVVWGCRGEHARAARQLHELLPSLPTPSARDRALSDLALALCELGYRGPARDAQLIVAATAQESHLRQHALVNLMDLAATDGDQAAFDSYYRELSSTRFPVRGEAEFLLFAARGMRAFGRYKAAEVLLARGAQRAEKHGLGKLSCEFEAEARALSRREAVERAAEPSAMEPDICAIASDLRARREMVCVDG